MTGQPYPAIGSAQSFVDLLGGDKWKEDGTNPSNAEILEHSSGSWKADLFALPNVNVAPGAVWCLKQGYPSEEPLQI